MNTKPATGEIDVKPLLRRLDDELRLSGKVSTATVLKIAEALRERLPDDLSMVPRCCDDELADRIAEDLSGLCCAVADLWDQRDRLGVGG